jgi:cytochrome c553
MDNIATANATHSESSFIDAHKFFMDPLPSFAFPLHLCAFAVKWFGQCALATLLVMIPASAYAQDAAAGKEKAAVCAACHGANGNSTVPLYPILAGQNARYIYLQLRDFNKKRREDPLMSPMAANLSAKDMLDLAAYFSTQKPTRQNAKGNAAKIEEGKKIADTALCPMCHLGGFSGQNEIPKVAGQHYDYIKKQLLAFKKRERTNDAGSMTAYMNGVTEEQIDALASYAASLN